VEFTRWAVGYKLPKMAGVKQKPTQKIVKDGFLLPKDVQ
jgi:hypothetical protein